MVVNQLDEGELKKRAKTFNQLHNEIPKIIRTDEKIDETIQVSTDYIYKKLFVAQSDIDEAKKEFPTYEWAKTEYLRRVNKTELTSGLDEAGVQQVLATERGEWFLKWFGDSS
jgi:hypothetical protein